MLDAPFKIASNGSGTVGRALQLAVVTETWPPEVNGVALSIARLVGGLRQRGHEIELVRPRPGAGSAAAGTCLSFSTDVDHEILTGSLPIPRYPDLRMGVPSARRLVAHWRKRPPDLVHIATEGPLGWSALRAARSLRLPVSSEFRTNFHEYSHHYGVGWLRRPIRGYLRWFHNATDCTMVPTGKLRASLTGLRFCNVETVARGVDAALFAPSRRSRELRRQWGVDDAGCVMVAVGRLAPEKNAGLVVRAFEAMRQVRPDLRLVFVGDGPARGELARRCPAARFVGARYGEELAVHYASADIFGFASLTETFGNVTLEAMASGLAVLAYDDAAAGELIENGVNGVLAPAGDEQAFLRLGCELARDRARIAPMGRRARSQAMRHDWSRIVGQVEARMRELVQRARGADGGSVGRNSC